MQYIGYICNIFGYISSCVYLRAVAVFDRFSAAFYPQQTAIPLLRTFAARFPAVVQPYGLRQGCRHITQRAAPVFPLLYGHSGLPANDSGHLPPPYPPPPHEGYLSANFFF